MKYDVAVVGAGPAGAIASRYAARNRARTLLIEEHASIGSPVQCTGLISKAALTQCEAGEGNFVLSRMKGLLCMRRMGDELTIREKMLWLMSSTEKFRPDACGTLSCCWR